jgi:DNA-binding MarR family transcriptional regulator
MSGKVLTMLADTTALVYRRPRTVPELVELTGLSRQAVYRHLEALEGEGLVQRKFLPAGNGNAPVWSWEP